MSKRTRNDVFCGVDEQTLFAALCNRVGTERIRHMVDEKIQEITSSHISLFPVALLAHVLSFVALGDVFCVIQVCKKWYDASRLPTFWNGLIARRLAKYSISQVLHEYDNFIFSHYETLRMQVGWLFKPRTHFKVFRENGKFTQFVRYSDDTHGVRWTYPAKYVFFECKEKFVSHGKLVVIHKRPADGRYTYLRDVLYATNGNYDYSKPFCELYFVEVDGTKWSGHGTNSTVICAHGKGKWTFPNGDTFEGDEVAFAGEPHGKGRDQNGDTIEYFAGKRIL